MSDKLNESFCFDSKKYISDVSEKEDSLDKVGYTYTSKLASVEFSPGLSKGRTISE